MGTPRGVLAEEGGVPSVVEGLQIAFLAGVVGVIAGLLAVGVRVVIGLATNVFYYQRLSPDFVSPALAVPRLGVLVIIIPALGGLVVALFVWLLTRDKKVSGTSEVMEATVFRGGRLDAWRTSVHALATCVGLGAGGSAGREGAIVQLAAGVGSAAASLLSFSVVHRRILLGAGAAGAISATFNTPIAGLVFAVEVVLLELRARSFVPLAVGSVFASVTGRAFLGDEPSFPVPAYRLVSPYELAIYLALGIVAGLVSVLFLKAVDWTEGLFGAVQAPFWSKPVMGGLVVGLTGLLVPLSLGVGYEAVAMALDGALAIHLLVILLAAKLVAYVFTQGSGGASGAFSPSLFIGSMIGGAFGLAAAHFLPTLAGPPGAYALVGMAAFYASTARATFTAIVMLFEMTRNYDIILPLILACVAADLLSRAFYADSVYTSKLAKKGLPFEFDMGVNILDTTTVGEVMSTPVETVRPEMTIRDIVDRTLKTGHQGFPVLDEKGALVGIITSNDLRKKVGPGDLTSKVGDVMTTGLIVAYPDEILHSALTKMVRGGFGHMPVVRRDDPTWLVGFLTRSDVMNVEKRKLEEELMPIEAKIYRFEHGGPPPRR